MKIRDVMTKDVQLARQARETLQSVNQVLTAAPEKLPSPAAAA